VANSGGSGKAEDAAIETNEAEDIGQEDPKIALQRAVDAAQAKVDRQKEHLEGAEQALEEAKAALKEGK
jgi:hypothetical protein